MFRRTVDIRAPGIPGLADGAGAVVRRVRSKVDCGEGTVRVVLNGCPSLQRADILFHA